MLFRLGVLCSFFCVPKERTKEKAADFDAVLILCWTFLSRNPRAKLNSLEHFQLNIRQGGTSRFCRRPDAEWVTKRIIRASPSGNRKRNLSVVMISQNAPPAGGDGGFVNLTMPSGCPSVPFERTLVRPTCA